MTATIKEDKMKRTGLFVAVLLFLLVFFSAIRLPLDTDLFWHLNAGSQTLTQRSPMLVDLFSYTRLGSNWINHSWLSEVIYFLFYEYFSYLGVMVLTAILATVTMWIVFRQMCGNIFLKAFLIILAMIVSAPVWSPRPQLFSLLCLAILISALQQYDRTGDRRILYWLILLFIIWSNLHAGFSLGFAYLGLFTAGQFIEWLFKDGREKFTRSRLFPLLVLILISSVAVCLNPNGLNVWRVQVNTVSIAALQQYIDEWASPNFHDIAQQPYLLTWLLLVLSLSLSGKKIRLPKILPVLFFGAIGFIAKRNFAPFALVVIPLLSELFADLFGQLQQKLSGSPKFSQVRQLNAIEPSVTFQKAINIFVVSVVSIAVMGKIIFLGNPIIVNAYENMLFPESAMQYLERSSIPSGNVLNSYAWGGYINWKNLDVKVMVDGRTDLFGDAILLDWLLMVNAQDDWQAKFDQYQIAWTFLEKDVAINQQLLDSGWHQIYEDSMTLILVRP